MCLSGKDYDDYKCSPLIPASCRMLAKCHILASATCQGRCLQYAATSVKCAGFHHSFSAHDEIMEPVHMGFIRNTLVSDVVRHVMRRFPYDYPELSEKTWL